MVVPIISVVVIVTEWIYLINVRFLYQSNTQKTSEQRLVEIKWLISFMFLKCYEGFRARLLVNMSTTFFSQCKPTKTHTKAHFNHYTTDLKAQLSANQRRVWVFQWHNRRTLIWICHQNYRFSVSFPTRRIMTVTWWDSDLYVPFSKSDSQIRLSTRICNEETELFINIMHCTHATVSDQC